MLPMPSGQSQLSDKGSFCKLRSGLEHKLFEPVSHEAFYPCGTIGKRVEYKIVHWLATPCHCCQQLIRSQASKHLSHTQLLVMSGWCLHLGRD